MSKNFGKPYAIVDDAGTSRANKTGSWKTMSPRYADKLPPCGATCPAGENIREWLSLTQKGKIHDAWEIISKSNPFPAVMGRVCYHTCEQTCNRKQFDASVNINLIEKSIGNIAIKNKWHLNVPNKFLEKKILIVGAGPSGLSAAYFLRKFGYDVTIYESQIKPGGMMRYGVPKYRLSRAVLDAEIKRITDTGVKLICNKRVTLLKNEIPNFDAVYIATGAFMAAKSDVEVKGNACVIIDAVELFKKIEDGTATLNLGKHVVVYGGGNTAIDAARTAIRLGAEFVKIVYRRAITEMPAHKEEILDAQNEGVEILSMSRIKKIEDKDVIIDAINYDKENDVFSSDKVSVIRADSVIFAIGQSIDEGILSGIDGIVVSEKGVIEIDKNMMTGAKGIFAGGDVVPSKRTVAHAIGHGKRAAECINAYLSGVEATPILRPEVISFKKLNVAYYKKATPIKMRKKSALSFSENEISLTEDELIKEANRCFSCGKCFHCDNCYSFCPDSAIRKTADGKLEIDYEYCKGCGICASECPCGAIKMSSK